ncbi:MAG: CHAT domain-containing protein, partial [Byssovorax sp.]
AHHLHEAGIPLVIASQLPLSFRGAAILAETLYSGLLWGEDPRAIIHQLRQELAIRCPDSHDWASLVAYAAFPADFDRQIDRVKLERRRFAVDTAMARIDLGQAAASGAFATAPDDANADRENASDRALKQAMDRLKAAMPSPEETDREKLRGETLGRLGSAEKRYANILVRRAEALAEGPRRAALVAEVRATLESSRAHYLDAFRLDMRAVWALVQRLALDVALGEPLDETQWITAHGLARFALAEREPHLVIGAHGTLAELYVLAQILPLTNSARADAARCAREHIDALLGAVAAESLDAYSVRHQLARYATWWWKDQPLLRGLPEDLVKVLDDAGVPSQRDWT